MDPLTQLALRARAGDERALGAFVESCYDQVWRLCSSLVGGQDAGDLAQETFSRAVRALPRFRGESSARTWVLAIARRACLDDIRARSRRRHRDRLLSSRQGPTAADASQRAVVADLVGRLDPDRRAAFVLTQVLGLSYGETAAICECAVGTVRSRVARPGPTWSPYLAVPSSGPSRPDSSGPALWRPIVPGRSWRARGLRPR